MSSQVDQVRSSLERFCAAWKTNDGPAVAALFVEEGTLINPFGERADGRTAVAAMYSEYFAGLLSGSSTTIDLASVRAVEDDHAFADGEQTIYASSGEIVLAAHIAALLRRDGEDWRFVDARPYILATVPG